MKVELPGLGEPIFELVEGDMLEVLVSVSTNSGSEQ